MWSRTRQRARRGAQRSGARAGARQRRRAPRPGCTRYSARGPTRRGIPTTFGSAAGLDRPGRRRRARHVRRRDGRGGRHPRRRRRHRLPDAAATSTRRLPSAGVQRAGRGRRLRARARAGADARDAALRLRRPLVLRLPRARRRHHLLVRQRHRARAGDGEPVRPHRRGCARSTCPTTRTRCRRSWRQHRRGPPATRSTTSSGCRGGAAGGSSRSATPCTPRSPSAGQGASLALEDAIVLARCLRDPPTPEDAFAAYQRIRQPRAEEVVGYARAITKHKSVSSSRSR